MAIRQDNSADKNTRFKVDIDSLDPKQQGFLKFTIYIRMESYLKR